MSGGGGRRFRGSEVLLHVYDLAMVNKYTEAFGIGVFHSGIEFMGTEYTFGGHESSGSGIFTHSPRQAPNAEYRTTISMGETEKSAQDVRAEIAALGEHFPGNSYSLVLKNCNHFSNELSLRLTGQPIPPFVNRLAYLGSWVSCILPKNLGVAHPESSSAQSSAGEYGRSGASAFKAFGGQGVSLAAQEMMARPSGDSRAPLLAREGEGGMPEDRRALLASAALARFNKPAAL